MSLLTYPAEHDANQLDKSTLILINKFQGALAHADIIEVCNLGLLRAMNKFNPKKGTFAALYYNSTFRLLLNAKRDMYKPKKSAVNTTALSLDSLTCHGVPISEYIPEPEVLDAIDFISEARKVGLDEESIKLLEMRFYDEMNSREIARKMKLSHATVNTKCKLALEYLSLNLPKSALKQESPRKFTYTKPEPIEFVKIISRS
jgi:RNA polymerase sigma factor (sigma-70 family)